MKKLTLLLTLFVSIISIQGICQSKGANMEFTKISHDFGAIKEADGVVIITFEFVNTGAQPIIIGRVNASCGCTTPTWTQTPVVPGGKGFVKAAYDPANRPGKFTKTINVTSNAENSPIELVISGEVIPRPKSLEDIYVNKIGDIRLKSNHVAFTKISNEVSKTEEVEIINVGSGTLKLGFDQIPAHIKVEAVPSTLKPQDKGVIKVTYNAKMKNDWGYVIDHFYMKINDVFDASNRITVSASIVEDFSKLSSQQLKNAPEITFDTKTFDFGTLQQNGKADFEFKFKNTGKSDLIIRKTITSCGCTIANMDKTTIKPGEFGSIKTTFDSQGKTGRQNKSITVINNDPNNADLVLWIKGNIEVK
jgi:hypothetical protein